MEGGAASAAAADQFENQPRAYPPEPGIPGTSATARRAALASFRNYAGAHYRPARGRPASRFPDTPYLFRPVQPPLGSALSGSTPPGRLLLPFYGAIVYYRRVSIEFGGEARGAVYHVYSGSAPARGMVWRGGRLGRQGYARFRSALCAVYGGFMLKNWLGSFGIRF